MAEKRHKLKIVNRTARDLRRSCVRQERIELHCPGLNAGFFSSEPILGGKVKETEEELYLGDFLALDAKDNEQLLAFQREHGRITSCLRVLKSSIPHADYSVEQFSFHLLQDESRGIEQSAKLIGTEIEHTTSSIVERTPIQPRYGLRLADASEVAASVENAQQIIRNLTQFANDGWGSDDAHTFNFLELQVKYVAYVVNRYFPPFDVCRKVETETVPLMAAIFGQLLNGLMDGETFKECPECHRLFQYKAAMVDPVTGAVSKRRRGAKYCSSECQTRRLHHKKNDDGSYRY